MRTVLILAIFGCLLPITSLAKGITFGPEWEFSLPHWQAKDNHHSPEITASIQKLLNRFKVYCKKEKNCRIVKSRETGEPRIYFTKPKFWLELTMDQGVIEVKASPMTVKELERAEPLIQESLFELTARLGLGTHSETSGAGHMHFDFVRSGFVEKPMAFRNFLADFYNHHEIATGILESEQRNARSITRASQATQARIRSAFKTFDRSKRGKADLALLVLRIRQINQLSNSLGSKYEAINLDNILIKIGHYQTMSYSAFMATLERTPENQITLGGTVEIRSLRAQRTALEFVDVARLFEHRVKLISILDRPVPAGPWVEYTDAAKAVGAFRAYVEESMLPWSTYKRLLHSELRPVANSPRSGLSACVALLLEDAGFLARAQGP